MAIHYPTPIRRRRKPVFPIRALPLTPIGDIATATLTGTTEQTVTWSTATDWDNASSETVGAVHETRYDLPGGDVVTMSYPSFDEGGSSLAWFTPANNSSNELTDVVNGNNIPDTGTGVTYQGKTGPWGRGIPDVTADEGFSGQPTNGEGFSPNAGTTLTTATWIIPDPVASSSPGHGGAGDGGTVHGFNESNDVFFSMVGNDDEVYGYVDTDSGSNAQTSGSNPISDNTPYLLTQAWSASSNDASVYVNGNNVFSFSGVDGQLSDQGDGEHFFGDDSRVADDYAGGIGPARVYTRKLSGSEVTELYQAATSAKLRTATKSFSSSVTPNLQNLIYSLNGETISLDVIGSPGTASEETVSQTLDGSSSYSLTWSNSHTDFQVRLNLSTSTITASAPTLSQVELVDNV